jgi:hypothetical protein
MWGSETMWGDVLSEGVAYTKTVSTATVATVGSIPRRTGRSILGTSTAVGSIRPLQVNRAIAGAVGSIGVVARATAKTVATGTAGTIGTVARFTAKTVATATASTIGTVARSFVWMKAIATATVEVLGLGIRPLTIGKKPTGTVGTVGTMRPISVTRAIATATVGTIGTARRFTSRTIATAVVSTVGTIWVTAGQVISAGASVVATVSRRIFRTIRAQVGTIGTVTDFLYDIVYAMNQTFRKLYAKVRITYTDPYFSAGVTTAADAVGDYTYTEQTVDNVTTEDFKWFSLHRNVLDGTFHPLPGDKSRSVGWWGTQLSDFATHAFVPTYPKLTLTHAARTVESILVVGDDKLNEYPVDFTVKLYDAADVLQHTQTVTGNAYYYYDLPLSPTHTGIAKQELEITKWNRGDSVCKISQFFTMLEETYLSEDGELVTVHVTEQRQFEGTTIPQGNLASSEITVRLNNIDGTFDPGNTGSRLYGLLKNNRAIEAWLGVDLVPSGVRRWYPLGVFYSRDWNAPDAEIYAEASGQDMLSRLQATTYSTSQVYTGESLQDLAIRVMTDAGLTSADWLIDAGYDAITIPYAWFDQMTHREALRRIAAAALGQCYCDRDGKVVLDIYDAPTLNAYAYTTGNVFEFDRPLAWTQMANYVEARATPRELSAEQDIVLDTEVITIPALSTKTKTHFFTVSPCQDIVAPVIVGGADVTVSAYTAYSWGISITYANAGGAPETVTSVTVRGKTLEEVNKRVCVAQDADSIGQNGKQTLPEVISSEFWQSETRAQEVADALLLSYKNPRRDLVMRARGNIAQLLGDRVTCMDSRLGGTTAQFGIVGQDISYDGGMEILVTAQQLGARTNKTILATVGTIGTMIDTPVTKKGVAVATVSTIGKVGRVAMKNPIALVGTVGTVSRVATYGLAASSGSRNMQSAGGAYATIWAAANAGSLDSTYFYAYQARGYGGNECVVFRPALIFPTGDMIPSGATITSAKLWFYPGSATLTGLGAFDLVIQNGQPTYPHDPVVSGDYNKANYSGDGGSISSAAIVVGAWNCITLNAAGLSWINAGAGNVTKLVCRTSHDIAGVGPTSDYTVEKASMNKTGQPIHLEVEWEV